MRVAGILNPLISMPLPKSRLLTSGVIFRFMTPESMLVIGGLLMEEETDVVTRIPILGHIPILGALFSDTQKVTTTTELMLVVSPRLIRAMPRGSSVTLPTDKVEEGTN